MLKSQTARIAKPQKKKQAKSHIKWTHGNIGETATPYLQRAKHQQQILTELHQQHLQEEESALLSL